MISTVRAVVVAVTCLVAVPTWAATPFALFESGQVRPLAMSPDGARLFAVNTPDNRLEIFDIGVGTLTHVASVPVGLEPVAIAARTNTEVWVVNHLSDSVSLVDLSTPATAHVVRTLLVGDEPRDIVFAGPSSNRAFITTAHRGQNTPLHATIESVLTTEGIGRADVWVFDATALGATLGGTPMTVVTMFGDTPRALAVSPDGGTVYAAVFHSGNRTTAIGEGLVPNGGEPLGLPDPITNHAAISAPEVGLIVKFDGADWLDELGRSWNSQVNFSLPDQDVFKIDANANPPIQVAGPTGFFTGVGTILFNMVANPISGKVYVANLEAQNEVRFEGPGTFAAGFKPPGEPATVRGHLAESRITVLDGVSVVPRHLNKHIDYTTCCATIPNTENDDSLGFPLGMAVSNDGLTLYVAGFGSSEVGVYNTAQLEANTFTPSAANQIQVTGGGPTAVVLDETRSQLYVLTRFDNGISIVNTGTGPELLHVTLHNPEPDSVKDGRPILYDTSFSSSHGDSSCASCHIFGDFDSLAWDLGNPDDDVVNNPGPFTLVIGDPDFHPMKGPMTTQSLRGMANHGPMHWRGDRTGGNDGPPNVQPNSGAFNEDAAFKKFNPAFEGLIGRSALLTGPEMQAFTDFILQVTYPPNPIRNLDNSLTPNQQAGSTRFFGPVSDTVQNCDGCHKTNRNANPGEAAPGFFGGDGRSTFENETQHFKISHLRNMYQKIGMFGMPAVAGINVGNNGFLGDQVRGFGFLHDGSIDTLFRFHSAVVFNQGGMNTGGFPAGAPGNTLRFQMETFMLAFDSNLLPIVGQQATRTSTSGGDVDTRIDLLISQANAGACDLIVKKGAVAGAPAGFLYVGSDAFESDYDGEPTTSKSALLALSATAGEELTFTAVPVGSGSRIGVDQDGDGFRDGTERDGSSDPADPNSVPNGCPNDPACAKCERAIAKEGAKYSQARSKTLVKCELAKVKASLPPATVCATETSDSLTKAAGKLASGIAKACGGSDKTCGAILTGEVTPVALGWPATCPDFESNGCTAAVTDCSGITTCLQCIGDAAINQAMDLYFDDLIVSTPGTDVNKCQQAIGKQTQKFLGSKAKEIAKCWDGRIKGKHGSVCPNPAGAPGSPARKTADKIAKAETKARDQICKTCGGADALCNGIGDLTPAAIGSAPSCPAVTIPGGSSCAAAISTLDDIVDCALCVTEFKVDCIDRAQVPGLVSYPPECNP